MLFSSPVFLFLFLPSVLLLCWIGGRRLQNLVLLLGSLAFYAWGERLFVLVMLFSITGNYFVGLWVARARASRAEGGAGSGRGAVAWGVAFNLVLLVVFKYANWLWDSASAGLEWAGIGALPPLGPFLSPALEALALVPGPLAPDWQLHLPLGISFFTFQALSYVVDVYRGDTPAQKNPVHFGVYITLFPQLIAGPIVRYKDLAKEIRDRVRTSEDFARGVRRFSIGLAKKMLVANVVALPSDQIFALPSSEVSTPLVWLANLCWTLQVYYDFSGYSDMAIGLGLMFGFHFRENFAYPYIGGSITEFWRRWHISLSTWFRDYLYFPLGGNRKGPVRTYANLLCIFFLCGLWHGASWNMVSWGMFLGSFLVIERLFLDAWLQRLPRPLPQAYMLFVLCISWALFKTPDMGTAWSFAQVMLGLGVETSGAWYPAYFLDGRTLAAILVGIVCCVPWMPALQEWRARAPRGRAMEGTLDALGVVLPLILLYAAAMEMSAQSYNPFIYFRF